MADTVNVYYQNVNGLRSKIQEFYLSVISCDYDVIVLTETFLNKSILNSELFVANDYFVFRRDRDYSTTGQVKGGGVLIAVKNSMLVKSIEHQVNWQTDDVEDLWITVKYNKMLYHICGVYLVNTLNISYYKNFMDTIESICERHLDDCILIVGDFNLPNLVSTNGSIASYNNKSIQLLQTVSLCNLHQSSSVFNYSGVMLDLVLSNMNVNVSEVDLSIVLVPIDFHHPALNIEFLIEKELVIKPPNESILKFWDADYNEINNFLIAVQWNRLLDFEDVNVALDKFYEKLQEVIDIYVPRKYKNDSKYPSWYTLALVKLLKEKKKFHDKWKVYKNLRDWNTYTKLRQRFKKCVKDCYKKYLSLVQKSITVENDTKAFWNYTKSKKNNSSGFPKSMHLDGIHADSVEGFTNLFSDHFQSIYEKVSQPINECDDFYNINISSINLTPAMVFQQLDKLDDKKSSGPDLIPAVFLKKCAVSLAEPVAKLFNKSLNSGIFPSIWKKAFVTPVHKSGSKNDVKNYRAISKMSQLGKVFEKMVTDVLFSTFKSVIIPEQHGFFKGKSTSTNLITFSEYVHRSIDSHEQVDVIYTDFAKAFDKVDHMVLKYKLASSGVHGDLLRWIISYLENRTQMVKIGSSISKAIKVTSGVPQGSHLGPLLFILFLNDVDSCFESCKFLLFADDLKMFKTVKTLSDCIDINNDLQCFVEYCSKNKLKLNSDKCNIMSFSKQFNPVIFDYKIQGVSLEKMSSVKDLGVNFNSKLMFNDHIERISNKSLQMLGFILRICKNFNRIEPYLKLYKSLVRSQLEYSISVWNPHYNCYIDSIERTQKKFCRALNFKFHLQNVDEYNYYNFLKVIKLDSLRLRRTQSDLIFMYKSINSINVSDCFIFYLNFLVPRANLRSANIFYIENSNTNLGQHSPINRLMLTFNSYCSNVDVFSISLSKFKKLLKEII